ncbi:uncharacterized protein KZ484_008493 [Pholidichthys leucotaenia]
MEMTTKAPQRKCCLLAFYLAVQLLIGKQAFAQIRYSVPEEVKEGTVVGNVAKDLGLDITSLSDRRFRVVSGSKDAFFAVNQDNGALYVHQKIDRERLCQGSGACLMELKILVENPLEMHYVVVEITDVNDHSPAFPESQQRFEIAEHTLPGRKFQLHAARDPDAGINSIRTYTLTANDHFEIDIRPSDEDKIPFLVLKKSLDREQRQNHSLVVTAVDGGKPPRSGTLNVSVIVLDSNDNRPIFSPEAYEITIAENIANGAKILQMNATDPDEKKNGEIEYSLGKTLKRKVYEIFELDKFTGEIRVRGPVDYEESNIYKLDIEASDKGTPPLTGECRVIIKIIDVNDNPPEIEVTSLSNTVSEDSKPGTVISLLSVTDKDSGVNGKIITSIISDVPFELKPSFKENIYSVITKSPLDREEVAQYEVTIKATDCGDPPLSTLKTFSIQISDVNDNKPQFFQNPLQFYLSENNIPGQSIFSVSASDKDVNDNAAISYHIVREGGLNDVLSFLNVNSGNGHITALKRFDFETLKTFHFQVVATDSGTPSLSSNVTVNVFILDQNDNAPVILYPVSSNGSAEGVEEIPRNVNAGHLVTKVRAYDADIGYNGWLLFSLQEVTDHSLFGLDRYTGQIRTLRSFTETDEAEHKLVILVKDNGNVSLSATATVLVKLVEPKEAFAASDVKSAAKDDEDNNVTFYLMITLGSVSVLFIISIIVLIAMQCSKSTDYTSKYLQETNYDGTLCHSIQYRSGDKRYMLVGPRMSIGSTIVPGSHANTLVLPDRRRTSEELLIGKQAFAQIRYSVPEEVKEGTVVGNVAKDLGLDITSLSDRRFRVVSGSKDAFFAVNQDNGALYVHQKIDRERLCQGSENNIPGQSIFSVSASDKDVNDNAAISYHIVREGGLNDVLSFLNVNSENGHITALKSFDFETLKTFQFQVVATDSGTPSLSSNVTVNVFILDQNDNAPVILYPVSSNGSAEGVEEIPRNVNAGHLVTKVRAYDADIGYNGWLLFSLQEVTDHSLFGLDRYTGQIRTLRSFTETDEAEHKLVILVKDNGNISLSATATVLVKLVEPKEAFAASDVKSAAKDDEDNNVTFYLMITLGSVSVLFIISIIVLIAMQCSKSTDYTSKYLQETNYDGTLCHSIQYRSGDKRYMLVGPRMSIGSTIVPGSHANTLVLPDRRRTSEEGFGFITTMGKERRPRRTGRCWCAFLWVLLLFGGQGLAELRYSIPEEVKKGTIVGNVAKDLGLDKTSLSDRRFRVASGSKDAYFEVNPENGALQVREKIDREALCHGSGACLIELKILVETPLEMHHIVVEITDVNDHSPSFSEEEQTFEIAEHSSPGTRFQLHAARDPDAGINSVRSYKLTSNDHFDIDFSPSDEEKIPFLVLKKSLDREQKDKHLLILTATDGGKPPRSGRLNVSITVLDSNDNRPTFSQEVYQFEIKENVLIGTTVGRVAAIDPDQGTNGELEYSLSKTLPRKVYEKFDLDSLSGEIILKAGLDCEESEVYKLDVEASDKGQPPLIGRCRVIIKIRDVNDNAPEIEITTLSNTMSEDSKPGTVISLISVTDADSGANGKIISHITESGPFELKPSYKENIYSIVTKEFLDREQVPQYDITIKAVDCGDPPLSSFKTLNIQIADVNDNSPRFAENPLQFYLSENNIAGAWIFSVSAIDNDVNENAAISYHILRAGSENDVTSFLNVNSENGQISALKSFDFETLKTFHFQVVATDSGTPSLSSNVTVNVFILDQNDNAPVILYPVSSNGSAEGVEEIPRNVNAGHLVTKVRAYDADIGYNGWLLFSLQEVTDHSLFGLDRYTGQIRTLRSFTETDEAEHKLVILVKDNGNVSLSATATVLVKLVEPKEAFAASDVKSAAKDDEDNNVTFYLMITLGSVSVLFIISIIVLIAMQCSKSTDYTSKYLQETNYDGTLCHSIQYRSGDKRYMLVGPRMSIGSTIVPGSHANTLVLPDRRRASEEVNVFLIYYFHKKSFVITLQRLSQR